MARSRWELEENRKKRAQAAAQAALAASSNPAANANRVTEQLKQNAAKQNSTRASGGFSGSSGSKTTTTNKTSSTSGGRSAGRTGSTSRASSGGQSAVRVTAPETETAGFGLRDLDSFNLQLTQAASRAATPANSRAEILAGGAARRRSNIDSRTGTYLSPYKEDMADLQRNQLLWHLTDSQAERERLHEENNAIRERYGLAYDTSGMTYDPVTGKNYSLPTQMIMTGSAADRLRAANQWRQSREAFGMDGDDTTMLPSIEQIRQSGDVQTAQGVTAHEVMAQLYGRADEDWTDQDTTARDQAVDALAQEMQTILERYGLVYSPRGTGPNAGYFTNDRNAVERLRAAGADETTLRYVQENIDMREAADRLGQGAEAVVKRAIGSILSPIETAQQQAANVEESRENPEYVKLEEQERQLENQLTSMQSTDLDGSLNADYVQVYNTLQDVRKQMNELAVKTPTDQNRFGQRMLREAAEAQTNATAGLATVPRFLANTGISIAGNAPGIAAGALIPGVGQAVGLGLMGWSAAGQRAQELSAEGAAPSEALGRGIVSGVIEAVTERMPIDELAGILRSGGQDAVRSILRQMGVEATEESASYLMNYAADWAANDPDAQFSLAELAEQALGGAVSGGVFGGAATIGGRMAGTGAQTAQTSAGTTQAGNDTPTAQAPETGRYASTLARLDQELQQAEGLLPGPARDAQVQAVRQEMERVLELARQAGTQDTAARTAGAQARSSTAQAGAWPEGVTRPRLQGEEEFLEPGEMQEPETVQAAPVRQAAGQQAAQETPLQGQVSFAEQAIIEAQARNSALRQLDSRIQQAQQSITALTQEQEMLERSPADEERNARLEEVEMEIDETWRELMTMRQQREQLAAAQAANPVSMRQFQNWRQEQAARDFAAAGEPVQAAPQALANPAAQAQAQQPQTVQTAGGQMAMPGFGERAAAPAAAGTAAAQAEAPAETQADVPLSAAFSYGATPQQAMHEAQVRAQGEAAQAARDAAIEADIQETTPEARAENPYFGLSGQQLTMERDFTRQRIARAQKDRRTDRAKTLQRQLTQIEQAITDAEQLRFKRGDRVFALDRNNFGEIVEDVGDGYYDVYFVNTQTGENGIHRLHGDLLQTIVPEEQRVRLDPQQAAEITGDVTDYSEEEFDRIISEAPDQYAALPERDLSRFKGSRLRGGEEEIQRDIEEAVTDADQQGSRTIVPQSVALAVDNVHNAYNKTLERVLDDAAGKSKTVREFFRNVIERPLTYAKGIYARNISDQMDRYYKAMKENKIKLGSKESAAVMWYGEGKRMNEAGDYEDYTLADLKRDFPKKWRQIQEADKINREIYDDYIGKIQLARREVYPYAEQRVEQTINRLRARAAAYSEQVKNLDAKIQSGTGTAADVESRREIMRDMRQTEAELRQKIRDRDSGKAFANQRLFPRKDYYHHAMEMSQGFSALKNILDVDSNIDPHLVGTSDFTKPKSKWAGVLQRRTGVRAMEDSVAAMLDYIPQAEYMINIDPQVARLRTVIRDLVDGTANANQTNANGLIEWLTDYTNDLAGKTNPFDRALQKVFSRRAFKVIEWINNRAKSNAILGNLNSALAQVYNLPNGLAYVKDPRDISAGLRDFAQLKAGGKRAQEILRNSNFMTERYLDKHQKQFEESLLKKPEQFAEWLLTAGDEQVAQMIYFSAYEQGLRKNAADPVYYADDMTRRAIAGRGVGEVPIMQKAKLVKLIAPFQVEVSNAYYVIKEKLGAKDAIGLTLLFLSTFLLNEVKEELTGTRTGMDLIDAGSDAIAEAMDPNFEGGTLKKLLTVFGRLGGEVLSNVPFGSQIASTLVPDEAMRTALFGESDPTRFGTGNIGISAITDPISQFMSGGQVNPWDIFTNIITPRGGRQLSRGVDMGEDLGLLPVIRISQDGVRAERQQAQGSYSEDGTRLRFASDTDWGNILRGLAFGRYATDSGRAYIDNGLKMLSEKQTEAFTRGAADLGIDEHTLYDAIVRIGQAEPQKDAEGNTLQTAKQVARRMLFDRTDLTPEQKTWLDQQLLVDPDSDQQPADYTDYNTFMMGNISESRQDAAREAISHGLDIDQFVTWDDRLRELENEKGADDKAVRSAAEARRMTMEQLLQDTTLSSGEKQAIADYVIIPTMSESAQEDWASEGRGHVNATDFVTWRSRISELENEKDDNDEKVYTSAEAREQLLDELQSASSMTAERREAIAEYVIIPSMGEADEKTREDWANIAKGTVSAYTYIRFKDEISIYEKEFSGTGADNMENVAQILREYDGLSDEQRDVLFQCYNDTLKNNPFHVSSYETAIMDNQFYKDLSEDGKAALRSLTNEYEQAINEGKELSSWLAKAYMANKEASIAPGVYALYRVALQTVNAQVDDNSNYSQAEAEAAVESLPGLTQHQKAYLWQSTNKSWKKNPYGSVTVGEYQSGMQEAINPIDSGRLSSSFGPRKAPTAGASTWHKAIDIAAPAGTPIKSVMSGTVTAVNKAGYGGGYGVSVRVDHGNGIVTEYHHMLEGSADNINVGDKVSQGQQIGEVGDTGLSKGAHLDMQAWVDGQIVDPLTIIPGYGEGPSGYVYDGTVSSGVVSSGASQAKAAKSSGGSSSGSSSNSLKKLKKLKGFGI